MKAGNAAGGKVVTHENHVKERYMIVHSNVESVETKLRRIAEKASSDPKCQFTSLFHLMTEELLLGCFEGLRSNAASGIDGQNVLTL